MSITSTFTNIAGSLADPTTATLLARTPSGVETSTAMTQTSVGVYAAAVNLSEAGTWRFRAKGAGAIVAVKEITINVEASAFDAP